MKKILSIFLSSIIIASNTFTLWANTDVKIFADTVSNSYNGTNKSNTLIHTLSFKDVPSTHWANEAITRAGALGLIKGDNQKYYPTKSVSNQEALAFIFRIMGLENDAQQRGVDIRNVSNDQNLETIWSLGYLSLARDMGFITNAEYFNAIEPNQDRLPPDAFFRNGNVSREKVANWLYLALQNLNPDIVTAGNKQEIHKFSDWKTIDPAYTTAIEYCLSNKFMTGLENNKFSPKSSLNRAQMAQILSNMDTVYNNIVGITKKFGTVGGIKELQDNKTAATTTSRELYIRNDTGNVDVIFYKIENTPSLQKDNLNAVVYKNGNVVGLDAISDGDKIEYLIDNLTGDIVFVKVISSNTTPTTITARLNQVDNNNNKVYIIDNNGKTHGYYLSKGLYGTDVNGSYIQITTGTKNTKYYTGKIPLGSDVKLTLQNNIVTNISYIGQQNLVNEIKGVVIKNSPEFGYLTIVDNTGKEITKNYAENDLIVEKQQYYETGDDIGYFDQIFQSFQYDPRDTTIDQIEVGDIVFIRVSSDDASYIDSISASTNYTMKYGKINQVINNGPSTNLLLQYENGQTAWYKAPNDVFVSQNGKVTNVSNLQAGDWVKVLVNEAVIAPGQIMESIKEINVEGSGHYIGDIIKGQIGAINPIQKTLSVQNSYKLTKSGWEYDKDILDLSINNKNIEYFYEGKKVSLDYVNKFLKGQNGEAFIALESSFGGDTIAKITFRTGRGEIFDADTVIGSNSNIFSTYNKNTISTDNGTIIRRNGRLVDSSSIMISDYASVVTSGGHNASIVDIYDTPNTSSLLIARGRVLSIDEGKSFKVKSMSILNNDRWSFTPVEREFTIDHNTIFVTEKGELNLKTFVDYAKDSMANKVFTIISNGTSATHVIEAPHVKNIAKGTVYTTSMITDGSNNLPSQSTTAGTVSLKDTTYYNDNTGIWKKTSHTSGRNDIEIETKENSIVIKNGMVTTIKALEVGDKIKSFSDTAIGNSFDGKLPAYLIIVEN